MKTLLLCLILTVHASAASYFLATAAGGGSDANNGLTSGTPWLSPNHALNCGDTITAAASTAYSASNFDAGKWGAVTCAGGNNVAMLNCITFDTCKITVNGQSGMKINASYWGVQGWEVINAGTSGGCFVVTPTGGSTIHHIIVANSIANGCPANGISSFPLSTTVGADYIAAVGNVIWNAAKSTVECDSGISIYEPIKSDSVPGTHIYLVGNFAFDNSSPTHCNGGGGGSSTFDGNGIVLDDVGSTQSGGTAYNQQIVVDNNLAVWNGGYGLGLTGNGSSSSQIYYRQNTSVNNFRATNTSATTCGDITELGPFSLVWLFQSLIQTFGATGCSGPTTLYGVAVNGADATDKVFSNLIYSATGSNTVAISSPGFSVLTNVVGTNPLLANPVDPGQPNCTGKTSTVDCMAGVIANYTPALAAAKSYGYQSPSSTPVADRLFPAWLCNVTLPSGLITMGCAQIVGGSQISGPSTLSGSSTTQ